MNARNLLRSSIPERWRRRLRGLLRPSLYRGDYANWAGAQRASRGYADAAITEKVIASARAVRDGRALWDRDTVLFHEPEANEPLRMRAIAE